jgi:hypothetical protein
MMVGWWWIGHEIRGLWKKSASLVLWILSYELNIFVWYVCNYICIYIYIHIQLPLKFPELRVPLDHSFYFRDFPWNKPSIWGYPHDLGNHRISFHRQVWCIETWNLATSCSDQTSRARRLRYARPVIGWMGEIWDFTHNFLHDWLVVTGTMEFLMTFHWVGNVIIPTDELHDFSEG